MFAVYTSSAGSGKTYTLTKEYLKLILTEHESEGGFNPQYFRKVLAITFTRDAAREMKSRVLVKLLALAQQEDPSLEKTLTQELNLSASELRRRAQATFQQIIYHYSDFSIGTIDSFTNRITAAFTQELNLPPSYELNLNTQDLTEQAINELISKIGNKENEEITEFLLNFVKNEVAEGENWRNLYNKLVQFTGELYQERSRPIAHILAAKEVNQYQVTIQYFKEFIKSYENTLLNKTKALVAFIENNQIRWESFYNGKRGLYSFLKKIVQAQDFSTTPNQTVQEMLQSEKWYAQKSSQINLIEQHKDKLKAYLSEICQTIEKKQVAYRFFSLIIKDLYKAALTKEIHKSLEEYKVKNNVVYIAETNEKIAQIIQKEPVPFIYEKIGERYQHILIDEFQDTSILQWHNLLPLVENNLANGKFNMIVGDAKQSIYRWRGGEIEQIVCLASTAESIPTLVQMANMYFQQTHQQATKILEERYNSIFPYIKRYNLENNYRSELRIITFNNYFFKKIAEKLQSEYPLVQKVYDEYFQQKYPSHKQENGEVQIHLLKKDETYTYDQLTQNKIIEIIEENLLQGFLHKDIAILCRYRKDAIKIANLLKEKNYPVISTDSLVLSTSDVVNFIMAVLKVVENSENNLAKLEALYLFFKAILKQIPNPTQNQQIYSIIYNTKTSVDNFLYFFQEKGYYVDLGYLQSLTLYEMCQEIIRIFRLFQESTSQLDYLFRFLDWVMELESQNQYNLSDLINLWEKHKHDIAIDSPTSSNAITVTTIHKSKGLEYPVVIVPYCDWSYAWKDKNVWISKETLQDFFSQKNLDFEELPINHFPEYVLVKLNRSIQELLSSSHSNRFKNQVKTEIEKEVIENLNLMYVAFTRAICKLYIVSNKEAKEGKVNKWLNLFVQNLQEIQPDEIHNDCFFRFGKYNPICLQNPPNNHPENIFSLEKITTCKLAKILKLKQP